MNIDWKELDGKVLKIAVAEPNPGCLERGQVFGLDLETGKSYLLHEWSEGGV